MNTETVQQLVRILMYAGGSLVFGASVADGEMYQAAIAGAVPLVAFIWWAAWERNRT